MNSGEPEKGFWPRVWDRARQAIETGLASWIIESIPFLRLFASLFLSYGGFLLLRLILPDVGWLKWLESLDQIAIAIVFVAYLITLVREAVFRAFGKEK